jgi:hypothetical protein
MNTRGCPPLWEAKCPVLKTPRIIRQYVSTSAMMWNVVKCLLNPNFHTPPWARTQTKIFAVINVNLRIRLLNIHKYRSKEMQTNSMVHVLCNASQNYPRVDYNAHRASCLGHTLSQFNPVQTVRLCHSYKINSILPQVISLEVFRSSPFLPRTSYMSAFLPWSDYLTSKNVYLPEECSGHN